MVENLHGFIVHGFVKTVIFDIVYLIKTISVDFCIGAHQDAEFVVGSTDAHLIAGLGQQIHVKHHGFVGVATTKCFSHLFCQHDIAPIAEIQVGAFFKTLGNQIVVCWS